MARAFLSRPVHAIGGQQPRSQSAEGRGFGSTTFMGWSQQIHSPSPAFVTSTCAPHFSQVSRFPCTLGIQEPPWAAPCLCLLLHVLATALQGANAGLGHQHLSTAFRAPVSLACQRRHRFPPDSHVGVCRSADSETRSSAPRARYNQSTLQRTLQIIAQPAGRGQTAPCLQPTSYSII